MIPLVCSDLGSLLTDHPAKARTCCPQIIFGHPEPLTRVIEFCCKPTVFAAVAIVGRDKFINAPPKRLS
jgi:hypothetical protein